MNKEYVGKKLAEISEDFNKTINLCLVENSVDEFVEKIYDLRNRLNELYDENGEIFQDDPKFMRIYKTLYEEVLKNISRYGNPAVEDEMQ